jgi:hypothetical protein
MVEISMEGETNRQQASDRRMTERILRGVVSVAVAVGFALSACSCSRSAARSSNAAARSDVGVQSARQTPVLLLPAITGGEGGWCATLSAGLCPTANPARAFHNPIVAESWSGHGIPEVAEGFALTGSNVAAVSVNGARAIATSSEPGLPDHLRGVVVELRGGPYRYVPGFKVKVRAVPLGSLRFSPLSAKGEPIPEASEMRAPLSFYVPGRAWRRPARAPRGVCGLQVRPLAKLVSPAGFVLTHVSAHAGLIGRPVVSCASNTYRFEGWPLVASVLLDATRPGSTPGPLPGMQQLAGHPGVFRALAAEGEMLARRVPRAWLIVARGSGDVQRLVVLEHLSATVHL